MANATISLTANVKTDPSKTAEILCSEEFLVETYKKREEVVDATYALKSEPDGRIVFEIAEIHYKRSKTGSLDKSGTTSHKAEYRYDPQKRTLAFDYGASAKFRITGSYGIAPSGSGSKVAFDGSVDVPIPLVGRVIAGLIKREMEKGFGDIVRGLNARSS